MFITLGIDNPCHRLCRACSPQFKQSLGGPTSAAHAYRVGVYESRWGALAQPYSRTGGRRSMRLVRSSRLFTPLLTVLDVTWRRSLRPLRAIRGLYMSGGPKSAVCHRRISYLT